MAGIYNGPARGGTRGGKDQFNWENVKADVDREYYLGHSVKALAGRWQKGKDVYWYTREKGDDEQSARDRELAMVKQREEDLMMEALGMKPRAPRPSAVAQPRLDAADMQRLMSGQAEEAEAAAGLNEERVKGLGYNASRLTGAIQGGGVLEMLPGVGTSQQASQWPPPAGEGVVPKAQTERSPDFKTSPGDHRKGLSNKTERRVDKKERKEKKKKKEKHRHRDESRHRRREALNGSQSRDSPRREARSRRDSSRSRSPVQRRRH